jgi:hypothetical protein
MPQNVRNFWVEGHVDGRGPVSFGGPKGAAGGFDLTIFQRHKGDVTVALRIRGSALGNGQVVLDVAADGDPLHICTQPENNRIVVHTER